MFKDRRLLSRNSIYPMKKGKNIYGQKLANIKKLEGRVFKTRIDSGW